MPENLKRFLSGNDKRILFVGIGNVLKKDDAAGVYVSSGIKGSDLVSSLTVEVSLENYIGKINKINPDILVLIDAADMGDTPGSFKLLPVSNIKDYTFNTHNISLSRISDFFKMPVYLLGIQPEKIEFGENMSYLVKRVSDEIISIINSY